MIAARLAAPSVRLGAAGIAAGFALFGAWMVAGRAVLTGGRADALGEPPLLGVSLWLGAAGAMMGAGTGVLVRALQLDPSARRWPALALLGAGGAGAAALAFVLAQLAFHLV